MKKTIPGNMLYLVNILWKIDRSTFWSMQLHILLGAIVPFISCTDSQCDYKSAVEGALIINFCICIGRAVAGVWNPAGAGQLSE
ncbi:MAG: hypothetical protein ACLRS2_19390 [[Clostridium] innocuum]